MLPPILRVACAVAALGPALACLADDRPIEEQITTLLGRMTLEEKIGQLTQVSGVDDEGRKLAREGRVGSFLNVTGATETNELQKLAVEETRLHIPLLFGLDVIHGFRTIFPIPLAEAATWDPELIEMAAQIAAIEAWSAGIHWTFAPMVDIARDARWGRIAEGSGEDPYLGARMAEARVRGFQGTTTDGRYQPERLIACAKHFAAYGGAEGGRDYNTVDISGRTLREVYLPPFEAAVRAGAGTLMSAFNEIGGVPATGSRFLMTQVLRDEWGFDGFVVSDWNAIRELLNHGSAATPAEAGEQALLAGIDMDMVGKIYPEHLPGLVESGRISQAVIDESVRRILRIKMRRGLFEKPYVDSQVEKDAPLRPSHRQVARDVARRSLVLLKNQGKILPLHKSISSLAVIGPLADNWAEALGSWAAAGKADEVITILEGLRKSLGPGANVIHARGCEIEGDSREGFDEAIAAAKQVDAAVLVVGEAAGMSGEAASRSTLDLPGVQEELVKAVHATGVPMIVILMNGRPLSIRWIAEHVPAILEIWQPGVECGHAVADVLFGDFNPCGKLPVTFPRSVGQVPIYYNHKNTGRPPSADKWTSKYIDLPSTPLFPFGFGLSYTTFEYSNLQISAGNEGEQREWTVTADVKNTGERGGDEVVQLYIRDDAASVTRPVKELKRFRRIPLRPGESREVRFTLTPEHLMFYNQRMERVVEPGRFTVWVGPSSADGLQGTFELTTTDNGS